MCNKKPLARKGAADAARRAGRASLLSPAQAVSAVPAGVPCRLSLQRGASRARLLPLVRGEAPTLGGNGQRTTGLNKNECAFFAVGCV